MRVPFFRSLTLLLMGCLIYSTFLLSCRRRSYSSATDMKGSILFQTPTPSSGSRVSKRLSLRVQLYDANKLAHVEVWLAGIKRWEKVFVSPNIEEKTITAELNVQHISSGKKTLKVVLKDRDDFRIEAKRQYIFDHDGPTIKWDEPSLIEPINEAKTVILKIKDEGKIKQVVVYFRNQKLHEFKEAPFEFTIKPSMFPAGVVNIRVIATDQLGNSTDKAFSFAVEGSLLGSQCGFMDSCKDNLACVRTATNPKGICRKYCRFSRDCPKQQRCMRVGSFKACLPKGASLLAGPYQACRRSLPCAEGLLCLKMPRQSPRCYPKCGQGKVSCAKGYQCKRYQGSNVCIPVAPKAKKRKVGERCDKMHPCVKGALCLRMKNKPATCYKTCTNNQECRQGLTCARIPSGQKRICIYIPRRRTRVRTYGRYQRCGQKRPCGRGLVCYGKAGSQICHPTCAGGCAGGCIGVGRSSVCLQSCDPMQKNCGNGLSCRFMKTKSGKLQHLCH